jgi:ferredoxin
MSRLRVDWPACRGHGLCAEVLPELLRLDEWGYPVVTAEVPDELLGLARAAAAVCPVSALRLVRRRTS